MIGKSPLEKIREEHARKLGISADRVALVRLDLDKLLTLGALIDIDVHGISMFETRATWEELGIPKDSMRRTRFTREAKALIPKEYLKNLKSIETRARRCLERHSFIVEGFRPCRWVPFTAYKEWLKEHEELGEEWNTLKAKLLARYESHILRSLKDDFACVASEAYASLHLEESKEEFVARVVGKARSRMPSSEELAQCLTIDYRTAALVSPSAVEAELAYRDRLRHERGLADEKAALDAAKLKAKRRKALAKAEVAEAEARQKERLLVEMRQTELAHYREQLQEMASPIEEVVHHLRSQMYEGASGLLTSLQKHGYLTGPAVKQAKGMVRSFRMLNALDDKELEELLDEVDTLLAQPREERDTEAVRASLAEITDLTAESARQVARLARMGRWRAIRVARRE